jgi:hypothetical protein
MIARMVGVVTVTLFMVIVGALGTMPGAFAQEGSGDAEALVIQGVIGDQLEAFKSGDLGRAYSHAAPNIKAIFPSVEVFSAMVRGGYGAIYANKSYFFGRNRQETGEFYQEVIISDENGKQWQAVYSLRRQPDGTWQITGVKLNPYTGAAA